MNEKSLNTAKTRTAEEYLMAERRGTSKNEFYNGKILAKGGSGRWHNLIASNLAIAIGSRLHGKQNEIYVNDMLVQLRNTHICYPNIVIVNGEPVFNDAKADVLRNPSIVIDIISSGANSSDKTQRVESYLAMESIRECLLIREDEMRVEHYARQNAKQWLYKIYNERDDVVSLDAVGCKVSLSEIYAQIKLKQAELSSRAVN